MLCVEQLTYDQFVEYLRSALRYLYDPVHLRRSPLVDLLGLSGVFDRAAALQGILTEAIRALKPAEDDPPQSRAWRVYDALSLQYIRQLTREAVAVQLGVSERQLRREQRLALEALAQHLWQQLEHTASQVLDRAARPAFEADQALSEELIWLKNPASEQRIPLDAALATVRSLAQPLAQQWRVPLQIDVQAGLASLPIPQLALRSILPTLLSVAIPRAGRRPLLISAVRTGAEIELRVTCSDSSANQLPFTEKDTAALETTRTLADFYDARLFIADEANTSFAVTLTLPAPEQIPVLVVDDNADWLVLLQRYAGGSRYRVVGTREPQTARDLAERLQPAVILLDVMMHGIDGWQILSELRHEPNTSRIPVVICTILPVEGLALSLGASAFMQKPVTQDQFLRTLEQQISVSE
jgi:CheY-like chemotaxis protein